MGSVLLLFIALFIIDKIHPTGSRETIQLVKTLTAEEENLWLVYSIHIRWHIIAYHYSATEIWCPLLASEGRHPHPHIDLHNWKVNLKEKRLPTRYQDFMKCLDNQPICVPGKKNIKEWEGGSSDLDLIWSLILRDMWEMDSEEEDHVKIEKKTLWSPEKEASENSLLLTSSCQPFIFWHKTIFLTHPICRTS